VNVILKSPQVVEQSAVLLDHTPDLLLKGFDLPCISTEMKMLSNNDALGVMLQLEQVLGISHNVCPTTMVVVLKDVACLINACPPLQIGAVLDRVQRDRRARGVRQALRTLGGECHLSSLLHVIVHVVPDNPHGPQAPIRKHGVGLDVNMDLTVGQAVLHVEPPMVLGNLPSIASLHEGVSQQHGEVVTV
jgi:hypothetical protein